MNIFEASIKLHNMTVSTKKPTKDKRLKKNKPGVMALSFSPSTQEVESDHLCSFKASMLYKESSRPAKAI